MTPAARAGGTRSGAAAGPPAGRARSPPPSARVRRPRRPRRRSPGPRSWSSARRRRCSGGRRYARAGTGRGRCTRRGPPRAAAAVAARERRSRRGVRCRSRVRRPTSSGAPPSRRSDEGGERREELSSEPAPVGSRPVRAATGLIRRGPNARATNAGDAGSGTLRRPSAGFRRAPAIAAGVRPELLAVPARQLSVPTPLAISPASSDPCEVPSSRSAPRGSHPVPSSRAARVALDQARPVTPPAPITSPRLVMRRSDQPRSADAKIAGSARKLGRAVRRWGCRRVRRCRVRPGGRPVRCPRASRSAPNPPADSTLGAVELTSAAVLDLEAVGRRPPDPAPVGCRHCFHVHVAEHGALPALARGRAARHAAHRQRRESRDRTALRVDLRPTRSRTRHSRRFGDGSSPRGGRTRPALGRPAAPGPPHDLYRVGSTML